MSTEEMSMTRQADELALGAQVTSEPLSGVQTERRGGVSLGKIPWEQQKQRPCSGSLRHSREACEASHGVREGDEVRR